MHYLEGKRDETVRVIHTVASIHVLLLLLHLPLWKDIGGKLEESKYAEEMTEKATVTNISNRLRPADVAGQSGEKAFVSLLCCLNYCPGFLFFGSLYCHIDTAASTRQPPLEAASLKPDNITLDMLS